MPAPFDPSAVELMRHLTARAKPEGHLFPLAMHSGEMMPPPKSTEKSLGERRLTYFTGVGEGLHMRRFTEAQSVSATPTVSRRSCGGSGWMLCLVLALCAMEFRPTLCV